MYDNQLSGLNTLNWTKITDKDVSNTEGLNPVSMLARYMDRHVSLNSGQVGL